MNMRNLSFVVIVAAVVAAVLPAGVALAQASFTQSFDNVGSTSSGQHGPQNLTSQGWVFRNQSSSPGSTVWRQGTWINDSVVPNGGGGYIASNASWDGGNRNISTWMILPVIPNLAAGDTVSYFIAGWAYNDNRIQLRYSPSGGTSTGSGAASVGDFTVLLNDTGIEPNAWTPVTATVPGNGRLAIRWLNAQVQQYQSPSVFIDTLSITAQPIDPPLPGPGQTVTWTQAMSPIQIRSNTTIPASATVNVQPGVTIQVGQESTLIVEGTLNLAGTQASPITLQSAANYPPALRISPGGTLAAQHVHFRGQVRPDGGDLLISDSDFAGPNGLIWGDLYIGTGFAKIERTTFTGSYLILSNYTTVLRDVTLNGTTGWLLRNYPFVENVVCDGQPFQLDSGKQGTFVDTITVRNVAQGAGLGLGAGRFLIGPGNVLENNDSTASLEGAILPGSVLPATGNVHNRVIIPGGDNGGTNIWADAGIPYYVSSPYVQFGGSLRILEGVRVEMETNSGMISQASRVDVMGTEERPVTFRQATPGGRWFPLQNIYRFRHAELDGAITGAAWPSQLGWGFMDSSIVRNCQDYGVRGQGVLRKTQLLNNGTGALLSFVRDLRGDTNPNAIEGNGFGVAASSDASYNWWGSPSGPTVSTNPGGTGDRVASGIPYQPFRTVRPDFTDAPPVVTLLPHAFMIRVGEKFILTWDATDDGSIVSQRVLMSLDGDIIQQNLFEPVQVLADNLAGSQRTLEILAPEPAVRFFGSANIRVEATDNNGQIGWDDLHIYLERDEPGELALSSPLDPSCTAGENLGDFCWEPAGISPTGGSISAWVHLENSNQWISLGGVTTYLQCLSGNFTAPYASTDRARLVLSLFTGGGVGQPEYYYGPPFTIRPDPRVGDAAPTITVNSPADGQTFRGFESVPIRWTASDDEQVYAIRIQASYDGGRTYHAIASDLPGTATGYDWVLPDASISLVRIKVVAVDLAFQDTSAQTTITIGHALLCAADFDNNGTRDVPDIFAFLSAWFAQEARADIDSDSVVAVPDIFAFLSLWFAGCA